MHDYRFTCGFLVRCLYVFKYPFGAFLKVLLTHYGADPDVVDNAGNSPIHLAVENCHELVSLDKVLYFIHSCNFFFILTDVVFEYRLWITCVLMSVLRAAKSVCHSTLSMKKGKPLYTSQADGDLVNTIFVFDSWFTIVWFVFQSF